ncbi:hypothetical protein Tco_0324329 [Tanacetum coccineum]
MVGVQNPGIQNVGNQNELIVVPGIANPNANQNGNGNVAAARAKGNGNGNNGNQARCYNCRGMGHLARNYIVRPRRRDVAYLQTQLLIAQKEEAGIQLQAKEFDLMAVAGDLDKIKEVNTNCNLMANLQQASTSDTQIDKAPVYDSDGSTEIIKDKITPLVNQVDTKVQNFENLFVKEAAKFVRDFTSLAKETDETLDKIMVFEKENGRLLRAVVSEDIMSIVQSPSVVETFNLQNEIERVDKTVKTRRPKPRSNTKNDRVPSVSKSHCIKTNEVELAIWNDKSEVVCAICKQCLITANHDVCVLNYANGMNSRDDNQNANVSNVANQKKHKPKVKKSKKLGQKKDLLHLNLGNLELALGGHQLEEYLTVV